MSLAWTAPQILLSTFLTFLLPLLSVFPTGLHQSQWPKPAFQQRDWGKRGSCLVQSSTPGLECVNHPSLPIPSLHIFHDTHRHRLMSKVCVNCILLTTFSLTSYVGLFYIKYSLASTKNTNPLYQGDLVCLFIQQYWYIISRICWTPFISVTQKWIRIILFRFLTSDFRKCQDVRKRCQVFYSIPTIFKDNNWQSQYCAIHWINQNGITKLM